MSGEHSPGPWRWAKKLGVWGGEDDLLLDAQDRPLVTETLGHQRAPGYEADRQLIAEAPALLALARYADERGEGDAEMAREILRRLGVPLTGGGP